MPHKYDAFISYAHLDEHDSDIPGTISAFQAQLEEFLGPFLKRVPRIWRDVFFLRPGDDFEPKIYAALRDSAVLILVVSPTYTKREWFRKELSKFLLAAEQHGLISDRVFYVFKGVTDWDNLPSFFRKLGDPPFFIDEERRELAADQDLEQHRYYWDRLYGLFARIARTIEIVEANLSTQ